MRTPWMVLGVALVALATGGAEPIPAPARTRAEMDAQLDALTKRQLEQGASISERIRTNRELWREPRFSSPEIDELRMKLDSLNREASEVQARLRRQVEELPAAQAERDCLEQMRKAYSDLGRQIEDLRKRREQTL